VQTVVEAVLSYPSPNYDRLLNAALMSFDSANEWWQEINVEYKKAEQAELNAEYANHIMEEPGERFYPSETALKIIVSTRRKREGYKWLLEHPRCSDLLGSWVESIDESADKKEIEAILRVCPLLDKKLAWKAIKKANCIELVSNVVNGLVDTPTEHLKSCLETICNLLSADHIEELVVSTVSSLPFVRRAIIWQTAQSLNHEFTQNVPQTLQLIESTLNSTENLCVVACHNISNENADSSVLELDKNAKKLLHELVSIGPDVLAIRALFVLSKTKEPFEKYLNTLLKSKDYSIRVNIINLAGTLKNETGRKLLYSSLSDQDYHCRHAAMWVLAANASEKDKNLVTDKANDPSAPVREACAEIIGRYKWHEKAVVLINLLSDKRDYSQDSLFRFHIPNYNVARAAAIALFEIGQLSESIVGTVIDFIKARNIQKDDIVVFYHLIDVLAKQRNTRVISILGNLLDDFWHMPGTGREGFPLRYAAAWGVFQQIIDDNYTIENIPLNSLTNGAMHNDGRLAGPCLICLGLLGEKAHHNIIKILHDQNMTSERAFILLAALQDDCEYLKTKIIEFIGDKHPSIRIIELEENNPNLNEESWKEFLDKDLHASEWIDSIQNSNDVNPVLRYVLHILFNQNIETFLSNYTDVRKYDLSQSISVMTTYSMFGGQ